MRFSSLVLAALVLWRLRRAHEIKKHKIEIAQRLRELCRQMGARQPDVLGDALSLLYSGAFAARLSFDGREQIAAVSAAAAALLDSPALGAPRS